MRYAVVVLPSFSIADWPKMYHKSIPRNDSEFCCYPNQTFFDFGTQNSIKSRWFRSPTSHWPPQASPGQCKWLPRCLQRLSKSSKTGPVGFQDVPGGVQRHAKSPTKSSCDSDNDSFNGKFSCHFIIRTLHFTSVKIHSLWCTIHSLLHIVHGSRFMILSSWFSLPLYNFHICSVLFSFALDFHSSNKCWHGLLTTTDILPNAPLLRELLTNTHELSARWQTDWRNNDVVTPNLSMWLE